MVREATHTLFSDLNVCPAARFTFLFRSLLPDGTEDPHSLHGSCPTTKVRAFC
jgi:hypothetical protein